MLFTCWMLGALALALYGQKLYDLVMIALKLVVIA